MFSLACRLVQGAHWFKTGPAAPTACHGTPTFAILKKDPVYHFILRLSLSRCLHWEASQITVGPNGIELRSILCADFLPCHMPQNFTSANPFQSQQEGHVILISQMQFEAQAN